MVMPDVYSRNPMSKLMKIYCPASSSTHQGPTDPWSPGPTDSEVGLEDARKGEKVDKAGRLRHGAMEPWSQLDPARPWGQGLLMNLRPQLVVLRERAS